MQGATPAQARAALKQYKDVEQAAERFFEGAFDHITDDSNDVDMASPSKSVRKTQVAVSIYRHSLKMYILFPS